MGGQHLTWENRIAIESLLKAKVSASQIAAVVGCSKRTVYREIQRGQCEQLNGTTYEMYTIYSAQRAQNRADQMNDLHKGRPVKLCPELAAHLLHRHKALQSCRRCAGDSAARSGAAADFR